VDRPRILLAPGFTELIWTIKPQLVEWAEVASYDPPGVGDEPAGELSIEAVAERGVEELKRREWDAFFIAADGLSAPIGVELAERREGKVLGLALGHAALSTRRSGKRAPVGGEIHAALTQLVRQDREGFVRNAIVQATGGSYDDELARQIVDRLPLELIEEAWDKLNAEVDLGDRLRDLGVPLLLAKHEGCLLHTDEGYEDVVAAFPDAMRISTADACCTSPGFAEALRDFCEEIAAGGR
jgi:hypothetical protein